MYLSFVGVDYHRDILSKEMQPNSNEKLTLTRGQFPQFGKILNAKWLFSFFGVSQMFDGTFLKYLILI